MLRVIRDFLELRAVEGYWQGCSEVGVYMHIYIFRAQRKKSTREEAAQLGFYGKIAGCALGLGA